MATKKPKVNFALIESAMIALKEQPRFELPESKFGLITDKEQKYDDGKPKIYESFVNHLINQFTEEEITNIQENVNNAEKHAMLSRVATCAYTLIGIDSSVIAYNLFTPNRGSFDWKKEFDSQDAEYLAFYNHVERIVSRYYNYRIFKQVAVSSTRN